jgi:hypothetical protein
LRCILLGLQVSTFTKYYSGDQIKKNEVGEVHTGFWLGDLREIYHMENLGVDGRIILKWFFKIWDGGHGLD